MADKQIKDFTAKKTADVTDKIIIQESGGTTKYTTLTGFTPVGGIIMYGGGGTPTNFLYCDGSAISRATYATLYAVIGTTYGAGNGSTTFNLPNYQGLVPIGIGTATVNGRSKAGPTALGVVQEDQTHEHQHGIGSSLNSSVPINIAGSDTIRPNGGWDTVLVAKATTLNMSEYGSYGTPRVGDYTRVNSIGTEFFIRYQ